MKFKKKLQKTLKPYNFFERNLGFSRHKFNINSKTDSIDQDAQKSSLKLQNKT